MPVVTRHLAISGHVQGVWYRESMRQEAERLGVTGWVRNRQDGSVEAVVQGEEAAVEALVAWAWRGPTLARVESVEIGESEGEFSSFEKHPTARLAFPGSKANRCLPQPGSFTFAPPLHILRRN